MKTRTRSVLAATATALAATLGGTAYAQDEAPARTRAAVQAELAQARAQGLLTSGELGPVQVLEPSTRTRADVIAQLHASKADGSYAAMNSTRPTYPFAASVRSRAEVREDLRDAQASGQVLDNDAESYFPELAHRVAQRYGRAS
jgi:hypothetical protein